MKVTFQNLDGISLETLDHLVPERICYTVGKTRDNVLMIVKVIAK
jgi:hypothetical protein